MFAGIDVIIEGRQAIKLVNPFHVSDFEMYDPKNVDGGTIIYKSNGEEYFTPLPLDEVRRRFLEASDRMAALVLIQTAQYYATEIEKEEGKND